MPCLVLPSPAASAARTFRVLAFSPACITASLALAIASLALVASCSDGTSSSRGNAASDTRVLLTDAPFPHDSIARVDVYVVSIAASPHADTAAPAGQEWVTIATPRRRFNLLELQQGTTALAGAGELPAGVYRAIRLVIDTDSSSLTTAGGTPARVSWPVLGEVVLHTLVEAPMDVPEEGADIVIDFDVGRSFFYWGGDEFTFLPWIRAVNRAATGAIAGTVLADPQGDGTPEPLRNASISVYRGGGCSVEMLCLQALILAATGRTDSEGHYTVAFLLPGSYMVVVEAPGLYTVGATTTDGLTVSAGGTTAHSVTLPTADHSYLHIEGTAVVDVGATTTLHALVGNSRGAPVPNPPVAWSSANAAVAAISGSGEYATVTGVARGSTYIRAASNGMADSVWVLVGTPTDTGSVPPPGPPVASLTVTPTSLTVSLRDSVSAIGTLTATARDADGNELRGRAVSWTTSDSSVALIYSSGSETGWVYGRKRGSATITATSGGKSASAGVTVVP